MQIVIPKSVWQLKGRERGKNVTIFGGVHGDELTGIEVMKKLLDLFGLSDKPSGVYERGDVVGNIFLAYGNPQAIEQCTRAAGTGLDLNRMFGEKMLSAEPKDDDQPDLIRARELEPILKNTDVLVDLHSTSAPSAPFIVSTKVDLERLKELSKHTSAEYILLDPEGVYVSFLDLESDQSTDEYVSKHTNGKGVGMCYETGYREDIGVKDNVFSEMINILKETNSLTDEMLEKVSDHFEGKQKSQGVYILKGVVLAKNSKFKFAPGMNKGWQEVEKGQLVGEYADGEKVLVESDGMYVFPMGESRIKEGGSLYYIAEPYGI